MSKYRLNYYGTDGGNYAIVEMTDEEAEILKRVLTAANEQVENNFYAALGKLREGTCLAKCVVDMQTLMNGINITVLGMSENSQKPLHITMEKESLVMSVEGRTVRTPFVEKEGAVSQVDCYLSPYELKKTLSSMGNGNVAFVVREGVKSPVELYNGSISEPGNSFALILLVDPKSAEKKVEEKEAEEE